MTFEYRNLSELGRGGFATVWLCERIPDGARYAKKVLRDDASAKTLERFRQEVSILSRLDHPNIVKIVNADLAGPIIWYVMPLYRTSLQSELDSVIGHEDRVRPIFSAILDAVEYAHAQHVLHRDLKPHNVLLNTDSELVVSDFGIGRVLDADGDRVTRTGARMGSTLYMAPEQATDSKHVDHRADIYGLGRMLYELYTERLNSAVQTVSRLPPAIAPIVERCTEYTADRRYQSVSELKTAWRETIHAPNASDAEKEARRLVEELAATPQATGKVRQLLTYLTRSDAPREVLRLAFTRVPAESVAAMFVLDKYATARLLKEFVEHVLVEPGGEESVDATGSRCGNLFMVLNDSACRAELVRFMLLLGTQTKRYSVLNALAHCLQGVGSAVEKRVIRSRLKDVAKEFRVQAGKLLDLSGMDRELAELFR